MHEQFKVKRAPLCGYTLSWLSWSSLGCFTLEVLDRGSGVTPERGVLRPSFRVFYQCLAPSCFLYWIYQFYEVCGSLSHRGFQNFSLSQYSIVFTWRIACLTCHFGLFQRLYLFGPFCTKLPQSLNSHWSPLKPLERSCKKSLVLFNKKLIEICVPFLLLLHQDQGPL